MTAVVTIAMIALAGGALPRAVAGPQTPPAAEAGDTGLDLQAPPAGDPGRRVVLRFVTEGDFPPFNYTDAEGAMTGFNVDLARAICLEVGAACDIKVRPWEELYGAVTSGDADGAIAAQRVTWGGVAKVEFSDRYLHTPGHFAGKRDGAVVEMLPELLEGKTIAVARGTAHAAYLNRFFHESVITAYDSIELARDALADGKAQYLFDDAISLSMWINGTNSRQCCEFKGGGFLEPKFFGDGLAIALPKNDGPLKILINNALMKVRESGRFEELIQRYFPARIY